MHEQDHLPFRSRRTLLLWEVFDLGSEVAHCLLSIAQSVPGFRATSQEQQRMIDSHLDLG
jgi:hypothetical protein